MASPVQVPEVPFDVTRPNVARVYNHLLGGKDNFQVDRDAAQELLDVIPDAGIACVQNRQFLQRAVSYLAEQCGIRQFIDLGTGLPTQGNVHEVAQAVDRKSHVLYVDYDATVASHARAMLENAKRHVRFVEADFRFPSMVLGSDEAEEVIDFTKPVAVLMIAILHFIPVEDSPYCLVRQYWSDLPKGSYLALTHATADHVSVDTSLAAQKVYQDASARVTPRTLAEVTQFFDGLSLVAPGVTGVAEWHPPAGKALWPVTRKLVYGGVARKDGHA